MLLYASRYADVHTVINLSGRFDLKRGIENVLGEDYLQRIKRDGFIDVMDKNGKLKMVNKSFGWVTDYYF